MTKTFRPTLCLALLVVAACGDNVTGSAPDARPDQPDALAADAAPADASTSDAIGSEIPDATAPADASAVDASEIDALVPTPDAPEPDAPVVPDASAPDAPEPDAPVVVPDASLPDAPIVVPDASVPDASPPDASPPDANVDASPPDANVDASPPDAAPPVRPTAFRVTSLELLDPHVMAEDAGCRAADITPFVNMLVEGTLTDQDGDGLLDFAPVMVFRPLEQGKGTTAADFIVADCSATSPTTCRRGAAAPTAYVSTSRNAGTCLGPLPGTTGGYTPPVGSTGAPCFSTDERSLALTLSAIDVRLEKAQIAATWNATPATQVTSGLLRGFMTEAVAEATQIEILGTNLAALLPGSATNGCPSDVDIVDGVRGWWFYLSFTAEAVTWVEAP